MKFAFLIMISFFAVFGKDTEEDCVKFHNATPHYSKEESAAIEKYYPQIASIRPISVVSHYLSDVKKVKDGFAFYFSSLESMKSHECKESGIITMTMDGSFWVKVDEKEKNIEWNPGESAEKPFKTKLIK